MPAVARPQKITFTEMRSSGVRGLLAYCADYRCSYEWSVNKAGALIGGGT